MLFEFSRWLSIVPALLGAVYNMSCFHSPPSNFARIPRSDYFIATLWVSFSRLDDYSNVDKYTGDSYRLSVPCPNNRFTPPMAVVLHTATHPHPPVRIASNLLAGHTDHTDCVGLPSATCDMLGRYRHDNILLAKRADVGHQQYHRQRKVGVCQSEEVGWSEVGLGSCWPERYASSYSILSMDMGLNN